jgi:hypothetical protein
MPGNNALLGSKPKPLKEVGTVTIFSVLSFNVSLHSSVLFALGLGSKFTTASLLIMIWREQQLIALSLVSKKSLPKIAS